MIEIRNVSKRFGKQVALQEISFNVGKGEFVFITGSSGSGKTTLLRMMTRDLQPDEGAIVMGDIDISKMKPANVYLLRRTIGVVFQDFKLLFDRTIYENVALAMRVVGRPVSEIDHQVQQTLKLVGLWEKARLFPSQLAGGELQRVCLARAVVTKPSILLADEPTGNLDPTTAWQIMHLIKKIHQKGTIVIMATHNTDIVNSMEERMIQLEMGRLVKDEKDGRYE